MRCQATQVKGYTNNSPSDQGGASMHIWGTCSSMISPEKLPRNTQLRRQLMQIQYASQNTISQKMFGEMCIFVP